MGIGCHPFHNLLGYGYRVDTQHPSQISRVSGMGIGYLYVLIPKYVGYVSTENVPYFGLVGENFRGQPQNAPKLLDSRMNQPPL